VRLLLTRNGVLKTRAGRQTMHKTYLSVFFAIVAVLAVVLLPLLSGCGNPQSKKRGCARPKVIVFVASWCDFCHAAQPTLIRIKAAGVEVQVVDIDADPELARRYGVTSVPTYFVYVCGQKMARTQDINVVILLLKLGS